MDLKTNKKNLNFNMVQNENTFDKNKLSKLRLIILSQLEHYSKTGERHYGLMEASEKVNIKTRLTFKK